MQSKTQESRTRIPDELDRESCFPCIFSVKNFEPIPHQPLIKISSYKMFEPQAVRIRVTYNIVFEIIEFGDTSPNGFFLD